MSSPVFSADRSAISIANEYLTVSLEDGKLHVVNKETKEVLKLDWPAVSVSINGKEIRPRRANRNATVTEHGIQQSFSQGGLDFKVSVTLSEYRWLHKNVSISCKQKLATPDYVEVDRQQLPEDGLRLRGYMPTTVKKDQDNDKENDKENVGKSGIPGCGYPLIGNRFFAGLEHPAGFNFLEKQEHGTLIRLRHYPVWNGENLGEVSAVFGFSNNGRENFADYLDSIRIPLLSNPLVSFCTFWSDPSLGNYEYISTLEGYQKFFKAFENLGLVPDVFTLDAGWQNMMSLFQAKDSVGGDEGLVKLRDLAEDMGSGLSLWVSHNGLAGYDSEYLESAGYATGKGNAAAYLGEGFGVMMDKKFAGNVEARFCELIGTVGAKHLNIEGAGAYVRVSQLKRQAVDKLIEHVDHSQVLDYL